MEQTTAPCDSTLNLMRYLDVDIGPRNRYAYTPYPNTASVPAIPAWRVWRERERERERERGWNGIWNNQDGTVTTTESDVLCWLNMYSIHRMSDHALWTLRLIEVKNVSHVLYIKRMYKHCWGESYKRKHILPSKELHNAEWMHSLKAANIVLCDSPIYHYTKMALPIVKW